MGQEVSEKPLHTDQVYTKVKRGISLPVFFVSLFSVALISMIGGYIASQYIVFNPSGSSTLNLSSVQKTYQVLREKYDGELDQQKLIEGANRGLVDAVGDPYTVYFDKEEAKSFAKDLEGQFEGIGAELDKRDGKLIVVTPLEDSPAQKAGLLPKDVIVRVNNEDVSKWSVEKAVSKIKGEKGTTVKLTIVRNESEVKDFTITRALITNPSVKTEIKGDVGVITISRFGDDTTSLTRKAAYDLTQQGIQKIILDLRGNGGGYLQTAQDISGLWLKKDATVVTERRGSKTTEVHRANGDATLQGVRTIVLVDEGSASASEIVAGALKDNDAAQLVGVKTFGKGSVQGVTEFTSGAQLKVTVAKWYTPKGKNISEHGITPDVVVKPVENDRRGEKDAQLERALELLK